MDINRALYISQEITPYLPATVMSTISRDLPQGIQERGIEVRTFMPKYGCINERRNQLHEVIRLSGFNVVIDDSDHPLIIKVATLQPSRMQVYFIDSDDYFEHHLSKGLEIDTNPVENDERLIFFTRGVIETIKKLRWTPSVIHCAGWMSALTPLYLKKIYASDPTLREAKIVYSLFNTPMVKPLDKRTVEKLEMDNIAPDDLAHLKTAEQPDAMHLHRIAMQYADAIVQAVPDIDAGLIDMARSSGKPFLEYPGEEGYIDKYLDFYKSL